MRWSSVPLEDKGSHSDGSIGGLLKTNGYRMFAVEEKTLLRCDEKEMPVLAGGLGLGLDCAVSGSPLGGDNWRAKQATRINAMGMQAKRIAGYVQTEDNE